MSHDLSLTDEMLTGIDVIDDQHRAWLEHFSEVMTAARCGGPATNVARALGFLVSYTIEHFSTEEKCMVENNYPGYQTHREEHAKLIKSLSAVLDGYEQHGAIRMVTDSLEVFLEEWLNNHIQTVDKGLARFLRNNGITEL